MFVGKVVLPWDVRLHVVNLELDWNQIDKNIHVTTVKRRADSAIEQKGLGPSPRGVRIRMVTSELRRCIGRFGGIQLYMPTLVALRPAKMAQREGGSNFIQ